MAYRKKTQEVKEETVVTPDVVSSEEVETQVINTNEKSKKGYQRECSRRNGYGCIQRRSLSSV